MRLPGSPGRGALQRTGPRGRHGFPLDQVATHRRMRLIDEFVAQVGRSGFAGTRVSQVCRAAGASTKAFYDAFGSKDGCLLRAFDLGATLVCERALAAFEEAPGPWRTRVLVAVETALGALAANPPFARAALVEVPRLGSAGAARLDAVAARFLDRLGGDDGVAAPATEPTRSATADRTGTGPGTGTGTPSGTGPGTPSGTGTGTPSGTGPGTPSGTGTGTPSGTGPGTPSGTGYRSALVAAAVCLLAARVEAGEAEELAELAPAVVRWLPEEAGIRAWAALADPNIQARNDARSFSPASAVVQLGASPDDAQ